MFKTSSGAWTYDSIENFEISPFPHVTEQTTTNKKTKKNICHHVRLCCVSTFCARGRFLVLDPARKQDVKVHNSCHISQNENRHRRCSVDAGYVQIVCLHHLQYDVCTFCLCLLIPAARAVFVQTHRTLL